MKDKYFWSAKENGFYPESMKELYETSRDGWPEDAVEISAEDYNALFAGQSAGKVITPGDDGRPVLTDPPPPTNEQLVAQANSRIKSLMAQATTAIAPLQDAEDLGIQTDSEAAMLKAWKTYRVLLSRITPDDEMTDWPEMPEVPQ